LNKFQKLGFEAPFDPEALRTYLSQDERIGRLFRYLFDSLSPEHVTSSEDLAFIEQVCTDMGGLTVYKLADCLRDQEVQRALQIEEDYERQVRELEMEIEMIDRQIDLKDRQREEIDIRIEHKGKQ